jgi:PAS domain S-box-containing protein
MDEMVIGPDTAGGNGSPAVLSEDEIRERGLVQILANSMPDLIYVKDAQCRYVFNNASHLRFLGATSAEEVRGKTVLDLFPGELAEKFYRDEREIIESGRAMISEEEQTSDAEGRRRWVSTTKVPLRDEHGVPIGLAGISRDITLRKRAEAELIETMGQLRVANEELAATQLQLAEATKLHTIGAMAAGIAHEVNNPLAILGIGLDYLSSRTGPQDEGTQAAVRGMRAALEHARGVVQELLDFARPARLNPAPISCALPIERTLVLMRGELLRRQATVRTVIDTDLPPVSADCMKVEQVLINLFRNALQAMPPGGTLTVTASRGTWDGRAQGALAPGEPVVRVTVDDTGPGIPAERLGRLFEPFFTTKARGEGTGLGLSVARNIMNLHGGAMEIGNRPEGGVRVTLTFKEGIVDHAETTSDGH